MNEPHRLIFNLQQQTKEPTMKNLEVLLANNRIGIISAHPDDHLIHGNALAIARRLGLTVHELTLTRGRASTVNHHTDEHFVREGRREQEGIMAAAVLGLASNEHWDVPDGRVVQQSSKLIPAVQSWITRHELDVVLTIGGLEDHADHRASALIAHTATRPLGVGTLELQSGNHGEWYAPTTSSAIEVTLGAAIMHASQFREDDLSNLDQYPIRRDAAYVHYPGETQYIKLSA